MRLPFDLSAQRLFCVIIGKPVDPPQGVAPFMDKREPVGGIGPHLHGITRRGQAEAQGQDANLPVCGADHRDCPYPLPVIGAVVVPALDSHFRRHGPLIGDRGLGFR